MENRWLSLSSVGTVHTALPRRVGPQGRPHCPGPGTNPTFPTPALGAHAVACCWGWEGSGQLRERVLWEGFCCWG